MSRNWTTEGAAKSAGTALAVAVAATAVFLITNSGIVELPAISVPDFLPDAPDLPLPDLPDWLGVAIKWGKFVAIAALLALALYGAIDDERESDKDGPDGGD